MARGHDARRHAGRRVTFAALAVGLGAAAACRPGSAGSQATLPAAAASPSPATGSPSGGAAASGAPATPSAATGVPTRAAVVRLMARTTEADAPDEHFVLAGGLRSVPDGSGGTLTAAIGQRYPTADGHGQLVFFWHGTRFLGLDSVAESDEITVLRPAGSGAFVIGYRHYAANDPECCPSLAPVTVTYRWAGARLVASGTPPQRGTPVRVRVPS